MTRKFYITTAIPYVNAAPHIGHALEFVQADVIARYHRILNEDVCLLSGGDENALKNVQAAESAGVPVQKFVDENTEKFRSLTEKLNCQFDVWQKGSDTNRHFSASQKLWQLCAQNGDIYKKTYTGLYCVGCEAFYSPEDLNSKGECSEHPGKKLDSISEENYFFRLSKYQEQLISIIKSDALKIIPDFRRNEVLSFLKQPLLDLSISRTNARAKNWGVPVPNDSEQRIYVWFDALNIYQSGVGFGWDEEKYQKWWPADIHCIGKGITRFHAIYWPALLLSAKLMLPKTLFVHGYFTVNGLKMSKTLGNVVDPSEIIHKYGADALRYYLLSEIPAFSDGDFSERRLKEIYNSDLANGLGNLIARVAKLAEKINVGILPKLEFSQEYKAVLDNYEIDKGISLIWEKIRALDHYINENAPWKITDNYQLTQILQPVIGKILNIAYELQIYLPQTAQKILTQFQAPKITPQPPLFPRLS